MTTIRLRCPGCQQCLNGASPSLAEKDRVMKGCNINIIMIHIEIWHCRNYLVTLMLLDAFRPTPNWLASNEGPNFTSAAAKWSGVAPKMSCHSTVALPSSKA